MDGDELRRRRERLGLSQEKLAKRIGVPRITVYRWEKDGAIKHGQMLDLALRYLELEMASGVLGIEPTALLTLRSGGAAE